MAYPLNVKTRLVSFGGAATVEAGIPLHIRISTESSRSLIWVEDGYRLESLAALYMSATDGQEIVFEVPTTDQNGWLDAATRQAIIVEPGEASHLYTTKLEIFTEDHELIRTYEIGPYAVPEGPGTLDADLLNPNYDPIEGTLTIYIPGPSGTLSEEGLQATQEAKDARDAAEEWRDQAEGFRDEAEMFSATSVELQDAAVAALIDTPGSETQTQLATDFADKATQVTVETGRLSETQLNAMYAPMHEMTGAGVAVNWRANTPGSYALHIVSGPDSNTANIGIGTDQGGNDGLLVSHKNSVGAGIRLTQNPGSAIGFYLSALSRNVRHTSRSIGVGSAGAVDELVKREGFGDGVTTLGSTTLTSATANFTSADIGEAVKQTAPRAGAYNTGAIPNGTTIVSVESSTQVTMSNAATADAVGLMCTVDGRSHASDQLVYRLIDDDGLPRIDLRKSSLTVRMPAVFNNSVYAYATNSGSIAFGFGNGNDGLTFRADGSGRLRWGPGGDVYDTELRRQAADLLYTPDAFRADGNLAIGVSHTQGGGSRGIIIGNATAVPSTNPVSSGVLYAENGALKWRGSSGTVTTIAPA